MNAPLLAGRGKDGDGRYAPGENICTGEALSIEPAHFVWSGDLDVASSFSQSIFVLRPAEKRCLPDERSTVNLYP